METIPVNLPTAGYSIHVSPSEEGERVWGEALGKVLGEGTHTVAITTKKIAHHCLQALKKALAGRRLEILYLPDGERHKNLKTVEAAYHGLIRLKADRKTRVLLLGGGVIGDLGGFAAATFLRGLSFIQIPTTLVGQVDSSIGGKLGVDLPEGKNLVGVFQQPLAVFCRIPFLKTLPQREILGGLAEVLKYGIIADPDLFHLVRHGRDRILARDTGLFHEIVLRSARIKARVVSEDEREAGLRMILNFGHTFGHAIEGLTHYRKFLHGEAVAMGMAIASRISQKLGYCPEEQSGAVARVLHELGLPTAESRWLQSFSKARWIRALEVDKKSIGGMIRFVFLKKIGEVAITPIRVKELVDLL